MTGEAKFIRAFCYFYLVNLFGDVPLITSTEYKINMSSSRSSASLVYNQIIEDLRQAEVLLSDEYLDGSLNPYKDAVERVRPTRWAALALLSRVLLYDQRFDEAESKASEVIENSSHFKILDLDKAFFEE